MNQNVLVRSLSVAALCGLAMGCSDAGYGEEGIDLDTTEQRAQCGPTWDVQDVESYDGTLGVTNEWVQRHEGAVGYHQSVGCSGTLISDDLFISAGHCEYQVGHTVWFDHQHDPSGTLRTPFSVTVTEVLEQEENANWDYAIVRLSGSPGQIYGYARLADREEVVGNQVVIMGHPNRVPKVIHSGPVFENPAPNNPNWFRYTVDTTFGHSGSGILSRDGFLVGVHTHGGCTTGSNPGGNRGMRMTQLIAHSPTLQQVLATQRGGHGWVRAINPSSASYTPAARDQFNSSGGTNTVQRSAVGSYAVTFPGVGISNQRGDGPGGNVQVVASTPNTYCKVSSWSAATNPTVNVRCYNSAGTLTDARFVALYQRATFEGFAKAHGTSAYAWSQQDNYSTSTAASPAYSQNDSGRANMIRKTATGRYEVTLTGVDTLDGSTLVTAYGTTNVRCGSLPGVLQNGAIRVHVACTTPSGAYTDSRFALSYTAGGVPGRLAAGDNAGAWVYANSPTSTSYTPTTAYQGNLLGGNLTVRRNGTGDYLVRIPRTATITQDAVLVSTPGTGGQYCAVDSWSTLSTETQARLFCTNTSGSAADSAFNLTYLTSNVANP